MPGDVDENPLRDNDQDAMTRANPRDYPGTALVLLALAGSSAALMLYRWLGGKNRSRGAPKGGAEDAPRPAEPPQASADNSR